MTAFDAMLDAVYSDPNMALDADYLPDGDIAQRQLVRIRLLRPDATYSFDGEAVGIETARVKVRVSEVADLSSGDVFVCDGVSYRVSGLPKRNVRRTEWTCDAPEV